jgi:hypothetical protein
VEEGRGTLTLELSFGSHADQLGDYKVAIRALGQFQHLCLELSKDLLTICVGNEEGGGGHVQQCKVNDGTKGFGANLRNICFRAFSSVSWRL